MRILNAIGDGGNKFNNDGTLRSPEWPKDCYLRCPGKADQELFQFLEQAEWADGHVFASARWWERDRDDLHIGQNYTKGTIAFRGSGIHFHFLAGDFLIRDNLFFLCEVPWEKISDKTGSEFTFVGTERFRQAYLDQVATEQSSTEFKLFGLQKDLTRISTRFEHLRQALKP